MSAARAVAMRPAPDLAFPEARLAPANVEVEQALLGAILVNNGAYYRVSDFLEPAHFFEDLHRRIYEIATTLINAGKVATPITLKTFLGDQDLGGLTVSQYLARLAAEATTVINAEDYGRAILDLAARRELVATCDELITSAYEPPPGQEARDLIDAATRRLSDVAAPLRPPAASVAFMDLAALEQCEPPQRAWTVAGLIPHGQVTMMSADGGTGKTTLALQLQVAMALGRSWFGQEVLAGPSMGLYAEDTTDELHRLLYLICKAENVSFSRIKDRVWVQSRVDLGSELLSHKSAADPGTETGFYRELRALMAARRPALLIIDSLHDFFAGNEILRPHARRFVAACRHLGATAGGSVLINAHPSITGMQSGTGSAGSTGWNNAVRSRLYLERDPDDDDARTLTTKKANYGPIGGQLRLRWRDGVFVSDIAGVSESITAEDLFLEYLEKAEAAGMYPHHMVNSANYAPKALRQVGCKLPVKTLEAAMANLFAAGLIRVVEVKDRKTRKTRDAVRRVGTDAGT